MSLTGRNFIFKIEILSTFISQTVERKMNDFFSSSKKIDWFTNFDHKHPSNLPLSIASIVGETKFERKFQF